MPLSFLEIVSEILNNSRRNTRINSSRHRKKINNSNKEEMEGGEAVAHDAYENRYFCIINSGVCYAFSKER